MVGLARDRVFPALVHIRVVTVDYTGGKENKSQSVGSGTIISAEGYVVTNQHVTDKGTQFKCTLSDRQEVNATLIGEDPLTDLAVLRLDLPEQKKGAPPLPFASFGNSDELQIGDYVLAMGSPFALSRSVTLGIVSNTERVFSGMAGDEEDEDMELSEGQRTGLFTQWIQHDASINPGNSGGPLVNLKGEVVGVNELGGSSMGFAIPASLVRPVVEALIRQGEVRRSWIGMGLKSIAKTGLKEGVLVDSVVKDGPAGRAGVQAGDVLVRMDGQPITVRFPEEVPGLMKRISDLPIGSRVKLAFSRGGAIVDVTVTTELLDRDLGDERAFSAWGFTGQEITSEMARDRRLDSTEGVLVAGVREGGAAQLAEPPLVDGDVIRAIGGTKVGTLSDLSQRYEQIMGKPPLPDYLIVEFDRRGRNHITLLKSKPDEEEELPREVRKAWIGISTQAVIQKLADKLEQPQARGYRITRVYPKTQAAKTDLKVGDIIVALNGEKIAPVGMEDTGLFTRRVNRLKIGDVAKLTIFRGKQKIDVPVTLEPTKITVEEAHRDRNRDFDLVVREVTFFDHDENRWGDDVTGVLVEQVEAAGWAGLAGIVTGDLIQSIDGHPIGDLAAYRKAMKEVRRTRSARVVFVVLRGARTHYQFLEPTWKPASNPSTMTHPSKEPKDD